MELSGRASAQYLQAALCCPLGHKGKLKGLALSEPGLVAWTLFHTDKGQGSPHPSTHMLP